MLLLEMDMNEIKLGSFSCVGQIHFPCFEFTKCVCVRKQETAFRNGRGEWVFCLLKLRRGVSSVPAELPKHLQSAWSSVWLGTLVPFPIQRPTHGVQISPRVKWSGPYRPLQMVAPQCHVVDKEEEQRLPNLGLKIKKGLSTDKNVMIQFCAFVYGWSFFPLTSWHSTKAKLHDLPLRSQRRAWLPLQASLC